MPQDGFTVRVAARLMRWAEVGYEANKHLKCNFLVQLRWRGLTRFGDVCIQPAYSDCLCTTLVSARRAGVY
jgi:hypothetical protein